MLIEIESDPHTVEIIPAAGTHSPFSPISQHASHSLVVSAKAKAKLLTIKSFIVFNCLKIINKNYFSIKILFYMQNFRTTLVRGYSWGRLDSPLTIISE